jgi:ABC-2 type transport system permease protein
MSDQEINVSKNRLHGLWALTNRDRKKWYQNPVVFVMGIIQPILWLVLLGKAMNISSIIPTIPGIDPGLVMLQTFGTTDYFEHTCVSFSDNRL